MKNEIYKYADLTEKIIGCAFRIHRALGPGLPEIVYHRSYMIELAHEHLNYVKEQEYPVYYQDQVVGERKIDFIVESKVLVGIKAKPDLEAGDFSQALRYLEASQIEVGLLINFGAGSVQVKRFINDKNKNLSK